MLNRDSSSSRGSIALSPQEEALQSLCKQILKSRFFRGHYGERRYVESVRGYRDIIALHRGERELQKLLLDMSRKLHLFYQHTSNLWIGITQDTVLVDAPIYSDSCDTYIWAELDGIAFGQYWFTIKSLRFRQQEIILKLKMVRPIEIESSMGMPRTRSSINSIPQIPPAIMPSDASGTEESPLNNKMKTSVDSDINLQDFIDIIQQWGTSMKHTVYDFMSNDVNKDNIVSVLRFIGLIVVSLLSGTLVAIKFLGIFTLRFMFEFTRLTHVMTPIILKIIEVFNKIVGGFYILVAMVWRDMVNRGQPKPANDYRALEYNKPLYKSIEYNVRQQNQRLGGKRSTEFERRLQ